MKNPYWMLCCISFRKNGLLSLMFLFGTLCNAYGQCGCSFTIPAGSGTYTFNGIERGVKPGDVICFSSGMREKIVFEDVVGASDNYVIVKNCNGEAILGSTTLADAIVFNRSQYIRITGTGDSGFKYGIRIVGTNTGQGVTARGFSSDFEIDHLEISNTGFAGIMIKQDPAKDCDDKEAERPNFTLNNVSIHDCYFHEIGGEGIYVGNSFYDGTSVYCGSTQYPHEVRGVRIFDNLFETTGWDAIQVGSAVSDVEIYNNRIYGYGDKNISSQRGGIQMGKGTTGKLYNNFIKGGKGPAIVIQGIGENYVFNNVIVNPGAEAINVNTRPTPLLTDIVPQGYLGGVYLINNTIVGATNMGIAEYINTAPENVMVNNLIVASVSDWDKTKSSTDWTKGNNLVISTLSEAKFVNPSLDDYRLQSGSPAINAGRDVSLFSILFDYGGAIRPSDGKWDAGAFEFSGNAAPIVKVAATQSVILPAITTSVTGSATDPDGTVSSYLWTQESGPKGIILLNAATSTLLLSGVIPGTYVFRLTATDNEGGTGYAEVTLTAHGPLDNQAPRANAGADKLITLPTSETTLQGSGSDPDGTVVSYEWSQSSGPTATLTNPDAATLIVSGLVEGIYVFSLVVTDNDNERSPSDNVRVTVSGAAQSVTSFSLIDSNTDELIQVLSNGATMNLTGFASRNVNIQANTQPATVGSVKFWLSGAEIKTSTESDAPYAVFGDTQGDYNVWLPDTGMYTLKAQPFSEESGEGSAGTPFEVTFRFVDEPENKPPQVDAGADAIIMFPTNSFLLKAKGIDVDGTAITYKWSQISGPNQATFNTLTKIEALVSGLVPGIYLFRVTATDDDGASASDDVAVRVNDQPPGLRVTNFTLINPATNTDTRTMFSGDTINMDKLPSDGINIRANTNPGEVGSVKFVLRGPEGRDQIETVAPYALFGDEDGDYSAWLPREGHYSLVATPYTAADASGSAGAKLSITFIITNPPDINLLPSAHAGEDKIITLDSVRLQGTGADPDGSVANYKWAQISGPNTALFADLETPATTVSNLVAGVYAFRLTVTDDAGGSVFDDVTITVNPAKIEQVVGFTLIDATTGQSIREITGDEIINLASLPSRKLNIRANTDPREVGSVKFELSGSQYKDQIETVAPYALFGDLNGKYNSWMAAVGIYYLKATPYSDLNGTGTLGTPLTITFTIIDQVAAIDLVQDIAVLSNSDVKESPETQLVAFPNPFHEFVNLKMQSGTAQQYAIKIYDGYGRLLKTEIFKPGDYEGGDIQRLDLAKVPAGTYVLVVEGVIKKYRKIIKVIKK